MLKRNNTFDLDYGELTGEKSDGTEVVYLNNATIGDGLLWNGSTITGPAYINIFNDGIVGTTSIATQSTWYKLSIETTQGLSRDGFSHSSNRITNQGRDRVVKIQGIISISSGNNNVIHFGVYKNGNTLIPSSEHDVTTSAGGRAQGVPILCLTQLNTNEYIEVWTKNASSTNDVITSHYNLIVSEE